MPWSLLCVVVSLVAAILLVGMPGTPMLAQEAVQTAVGPRPLITQPIDESQLTTLKGNVHPLARPVFDVGRAPATLPMERMLLVLKRSPEQETALRKLLDDQQNKASASYHKWLTPEQFGKQFGPSDDDMQKITAWLQSHGFQVKAPSKGRTVTEFSGSTSQVQETFHTTIHKYVVNGEQHWANASDPKIPTALTGAVVGLLSLHNFPARSFHKTLGAFERTKASGEVKPLKPLFTFPGMGCGVQQTTCYAVGPFDFATIYDVLPLWNANPAIDGTGQTIAIVAETEINAQDVAGFRNFFGLPSANFQPINDGPSPGIIGDETESDLDVQWSGAVAKGATIDFVISATTDTTLGVALSAEYIVDQNLAPVMSMSYGLCELATGTAGNQFYNQLWQQASAQGITAIVSSGDNGAAGCDPHGATPPAPAQFGLAVTGWGDTPYNVSVGGTDFFDLTNQSTYWNSANASLTQASAKGPIPEATWNNTCTNSVFGDLLGFSSNAETNCNNSQLVNFVSTDGGSGGVSNCTVNDNATVTSCSGGYGKPAWQMGNGVPADSKRDIPDVSLFAAAGSPSGSFYIICESDLLPAGSSSCDPTNSSTHFIGIGGTSASAPAFAGIMALVNQATGERQGNANYVLYPMATQVPTAFHDVTAGTISMPCATGSPNCTTAIAGDVYGLLSGYNAGTGYDIATGLGSIDANVMVTNWSTVAGTFTPTTTTLGLGSLNITHGTPDTVTITVAPKNVAGPPFPSGNVSLIANTGITSPSGIGQTGVQSFALNSSTGSVSLPTSSLPGGANGYTVTAHYPGDGTFGASDSAPLTVKVAPEPSSTVVSVLTQNAQGGITGFSSGPFGSVVYVKAQIVGTNQGAPCPSSACPTGMVTFSDNGTCNGATPCPLPGPIFNPVANPVSLNSEGNTSIGAGVINFDDGTHTILASYAGDNSFQPSSSSSLTFTIQPGFAGVSGLGPVTITAPGGSGTTSVGIIASTGFSTAITFACSNLPAEATCSPASATGKGPNTVVNTTITINTTASHTTMLQSNQRPYYYALLLGGGSPLAGIFVVAASRRRWSALLGLILLTAFLVAVPACGGGGGGTTHQLDPGTPTGTYTVTLTATAGSLSEQGQFVVVVQ